MDFYTKVNKYSEYPVSIDGSELESLTVSKDLGVLFDNNLYFSALISCMVTKGKAATFLTL